MIAVNLTIDDLAVNICSSGKYAPDVADDLANRAVTMLNQAAAIQLAQYAKIAELNIVQTGEPE